MFCEGLVTYLDMKPELLDRLFPQLDTLINIHFEFLRQLRIRQVRGEGGRNGGREKLGKRGKSRKTWKQACGNPGMLDYRIPARIFCGRMRLKLKLCALNCAARAIKGSGNCFPPPLRAEAGGWVRREFHKTGN